MTYVPCRYEEIKQLCVDRWNAYHSPLHAAAYILDPQFQHGLQWKDKEVMNGWNTILERLVPDTKERTEIRKQVNIYRNGKTELCHTLDAQAARLEMGSALWWEEFGAGLGGLQDLAIRILSQACTTSCLEQLWSVYAHVASKKRNRLDVKRANDLIYVSANLKMLSKVDQSDTFADWAHIEEDSISEKEIDAEAQLEDDPMHHEDHTEEVTIQLAPWTNL